MMIKIKVIIFWISCFLCLNTFSQWKWINPLPQGHALSCAWFFNKDTGFVAGWAGTIMKTTDGGNSWTIKMFENWDEYYDLQSIYFTDETTGYLIDNYDQVYKTTDAGNSWNLIYTGVYGEGLESIVFTDNQHGFVAGAGGLILKTSNGGINWDHQFLNPPGEYRSICFATTQSGYIAGYNGIIMHTSDGGASWVPQSSGATSKLNGIHFVSPEEGYIFGDEGVLLKTTDGGVNWIPDQKIDSLEFLSLSSFNKDTLIIIGMELTGVHSDFDILKTIDGGNSWAIVKIYNETPAPRTVFCLPDGTAYSIGIRGSVYKSIDAGSAWNLVTNYLTLNSISCIDFPTADVGYASMFGYEFVNDVTVLKTIDGGDSWFATDSDFGSEIFSAIDFPTEDIGFIGGTNIYRTLDGGNTWTLRYSSSWDKRIKSIAFAIPTRGIAVGGDGLILRTTNAGLNWYPIESGTTSILNSVCMPAVNTGYIAGSRVILKTTDGGASWALNPVPYELNGIFFTDAETGFAVGDEIILKTTNGGENWVNIAPPGLDIPFLAVHFFDSDTGYVAGGIYDVTGLVLKTTDGGLHWTEEDIPTDHPIDCIHVTSTYKVYAGGYPGFFFGNSNELLTGISGQAPDQNDNPVECFPNPFQTSTTLKYMIDHPAYVKLVIYDQSGKQIETLVNQHQNAGIYEVPCEGSNLNAGVYLYKLTVGNQTTSKKVVLFK
jgi:photosystem II stability/assembly factor-like uncharacterized protein